VMMVMMVMMVSDKSIDIIKDDYQITYQANEFYYVSKHISENSLIL
jgi:hypothetical protein